MKPIFIALVIALTSSSLLVQEQAGSAIPESQKRDITIPSANGDPIRISYGGDAASVKVDGKQLAAKNDVVAAPTASRHLQSDPPAEQEVPMDTTPKELTHSTDIIEMSENDVVNEDLIAAAENIIDKPDATVVQRANAVIILLTPLSDFDADDDASNDQVVLSRDQANDIKAVIALLVANIPDDNLVAVQDTVDLTEVPDAAVELPPPSGDDGTGSGSGYDGTGSGSGSGSDPIADPNDPNNPVDPIDPNTPSDPNDPNAGQNSRRKNVRRRRAKALRRVSRVRAMRRRRHRAMSIRTQFSRNNRFASNFRRRRVLRLAPPHFVRYNTAAAIRNRHLMGTPAPKIEATATATTTAPVTENKEVV